ncbi:Zn(2)-C6 fungal-type domain-containing protein [Mycena chlorophos]|uniref:Zn(2)-C6 fungal-type domain-containing protein n=1 Tax=Mycena chlorophos TaxID=658473 RepID=A0A8H6WG43_MYCCL|nr:Zn(2)-C6 fungal-type domain-containing protein [Mycena chlorophos]
MDYSDASDDDGGQRESSHANRKRSSRACDQCRKTKSKCERGSNAAACKGCEAAKTVCTFLGPSYKRGPPKGYIHAIESRWHQVESLLGALLQCPDSRVQGLRTDEFAREILGRVDAGPYGPAGRLDQPGGATKKDLFASILRSSSAGPAESSRSRRQSRVSREQVSSIAQDDELSFVPTREWQDSLSNRITSSSGSSSRLPSFDLSGVPLPQRRRLDASIDGTPTPPDWNNMYTLEDPVESPTAAPVEAMGALSLDEHQELRFHGPSSGLDMLGRNIRTDSRKEGALWDLPMARVWPLKDPATIVQEEDLDIELPPQHVQEHLLQLYFAYVHPIFPLIHKTRFLTEYNTRHMASPVNSPTDCNQSHPKPESAQKYSPLLLLAMFAVSARFSDQDTPPPAKGKMWEAGAKYFVAAKNILAKVLHRSRPSTCQALLLLGYREFGIGSMEQGWIYIGMAIRMALDLGLNANLVEWKSSAGDRLLFSQEDTQTRRQIWWACCGADRYASMYMGRPIAIHDDDFNTPLPDDEDEQPWESFSEGSPHHPGLTLSTFRSTSKLALILGAVITRIYPIRSTPLASRKAYLANLESRLDQWYLTLPDSLRYESRRLAPSPQVLLLHMRYWGTVLLLHRAFIPNWKGIDPAPQNSTFELKSFDLAQGAATHISAIVTAYRDAYTLKRCSPFVTSYLLNAGIMHITTLTLRPSNPQASVGLQQVLMALKEMEMIWPSAARAYELLNGVKLGHHAPLPPTTSHERHKRHAEDAFGEERTPDYPNRDVDGVQDMANKLMAHMLGLDAPGVEPSTSLYSGCDWWGRPSPETSQWPAQFTSANLGARGWPEQQQYNGEYPVQQFDHFGV